MSRGRGSRRVAYVGAGLAAAMIIAAAIAFTQGNVGGSNAGKYTPLQDNPPAATQTGRIAGPSAADLMSAGAPVLGDPDAPVTIVDFSDFQCTNCRRFATQTEPQIIRDYVDSGKVNIVFMHFPVFGPDSVTAAMASMCANEQGMFWEFHDHLYENQGMENSGWADADAMKAFASDLGLDRGKFGSCLDSKKYKEYVEGDLALALGLKFPGTPSFIIMKSDGSDAEALVGAQPYTSFKSVLDRKLA